MAIIYIYDEIGPDWLGMVSAKSIREQLDAAKNEEVELHINSPGGDVFEAKAIHTMLTEHKPGVVVRIDGLAASAASFIAMAGKSIAIADGAMMMIHNSISWTFGNKAEHEKRIDLLSKVDESIGGIYAARTKATRKQIADWMDAETWMTAHEALECGFVDSVGGQGAPPAAIKEGRFKNTPKELVVAELPRESNRRAVERYYAVKLRLTGSSRSA